MCLQWPQAAASLFRVRTKLTHYQINRQERCAKFGLRGATATNEERAVRAFPAVVYAAVSSINAWMLKALSWYPDANCSEMPQSA